MAHEWYMEAYYILRYSKSENGFIPLSEILAYANHFEIIGSVKEFISVIQSLDLAEDKIHKAESKRNEKNNHKSR